MNIVEYVLAGLIVAVALYFIWRAADRAAARYVQVAVGRALAAPFQVAITEEKREAAEAYVRASGKASAAFTRQLKDLAAEHQLTSVQAAEAMREGGLYDASRLVEATPAPAVA